MKLARSLVFFLPSFFAICFSGFVCGCCRENQAGCITISREGEVWTMPESIYFNYVLPQTSIGEACDDWRPLFRKKFLPLVKGCKTTTAAAEKLNREIWDVLGVHYSPTRDKPDQSPFHSMRIGKASCTGLSILLINACRAVDIPARFVGCRWKNKPGNHSWVEIWDNGEWKHLGAGDGGVANQAWFDADASQADAEDPRFAIYAACVEPTGLMFPRLWTREGGDSEVPAINVTERYLTFAQKVPDGFTRVAFDLCSIDGGRLAEFIVVLDVETREEVARGITRSNRFDLNDHLSFVFPQGRKLCVVSAEDHSRVFVEFVVPDKEQVLKINIPQR